MKFLSFSCSSFPLKIKLKKISFQYRFDTKNSWFSWGYIEMFTRYTQDTSLALSLSHKTHPPNLYIQVLQSVDYISMEMEKHYLRDLQSFPSCWKTRKIKKWGNKELKGRRVKQEARTLQKHQGASCVLHYFLYTGFNLHISKYM